MKIIILLSLLVLIMKGPTNSLYPSNIQLLRGVRRGDVISPKLCTSALEDMLMTLDWKGMGTNINVRISTGLHWERVRCSVDTGSENSGSPTLTDIGRLPWLGVIQHDFSVGDKKRFAVTTGILIHPAYVVAPAEDIGKILPNQLANNTKFIVWYSETIKYAMEVHDYILHPEYTEGRTFATIALLQLITHGETGVGSNPKPVLPVCIPLKGAGSFTDIYAAKMSDENKVLQKELYKMKFVDSRDCEEFYYIHKLNYKKMAPAFPTCAMAEQPMEPCVWDAGAALITKQNWGYWTLLGFGVRGAGCGAPARFLSLYDYLPWIDDMTVPQPADRDLTRIGVRRLSPYEIVMYDADKKIAPETGQCDRKVRGNVQYKDAFEVVMTKNMGQGFFFVAVSQIASFTCAIVRMEEVTAKTNTGVWIEHNCYREPAGHGKPKDHHKMQCFLYFKSTAFVEFRFYFSFKAVVELSLYGTKEDEPRREFQPFGLWASTYPWWPTSGLIDWYSFLPIGMPKDNL